MVDFNEVYLHEMTLNLHMHAWIFCRLSIAIVDGKQYLSEVVFSVSTDFHCKENDGTICFLGHIPIPRTCHHWLWYSRSRSQFWSPACPGCMDMTWKPNYFNIFLTMKIRKEHYTLSHANATCHELTLLTSAKKFTLAYEGSRSPHASALHWNPSGFRKKK
jgi:hypothetical protein